MRCLGLWCVLLLTFVPVYAVEESQLPEAVGLLWQQVQAQPQDAAFACVPLQNRGQAVFHQAGAVFPLASVAKLLVFIEYALRLDAGAITLGEMVAVEELERYNLPRTDRGAHDRFMAAYPDGTTQLSLWDVASVGMMGYSSNAASDYLLQRLGMVDWPSLLQRLGMFSSTPPHALTMIPLLMNNHSSGRATSLSLPDLTRSQGELYFDAYLHDAVWRQAELAYRNGRNSRTLWPDWDVQAVILQQYTATGNVNDYINALSAIYNPSSPLSPNVRYMVREALRWYGNAYIDENYIEYGSKLGFYSGGTLTLIAYGQPYNGDPVLTAIFLRNIPRSTYQTLLREDAIGAFAHWLNFRACADLPTLQTNLAPF